MFHDETSYLFFNQTIFVRKCNSLRNQPIATILENKSNFFMISNQASLIRRLFLLK